MGLKQLIESLLELSSTTDENIKKIEIIEAVTKELHRICPPVEKTIQYSTDIDRCTSLLHADQDQEIGDLLKELHSELICNGFTETKSENMDGVLLRLFLNYLISILTLPAKQNEMNLLSKSFECLSALVQFRVVIAHCTTAKNNWNKIHMDLGLAIKIIAARLLDEFSAPFDRMRDNILDLPKLLLLCPREECIKDIIRDAIFFQLASKGGHATLAAAELLSYVVTAASVSVLYQDMSDDNKPDCKDIIALKRELKMETMAVVELQFFSNVFDEIVSKLNESEINTNDEASNDALMKVVRQLYQHAPDAVRRCIDERCGKNSGVIKEKVCGEKDSISKILTAETNETIIQQQKQHVSTGERKTSSLARDDEGSNLSSIIRSIPDPITIESEAGLDLFFESIQLDFGNTHADKWKNRRESLIKLQRLIAGRNIQIHGTEVIIAHMQGLPLQTQIEDLRSQVTRQSCKVTVYLAYILKEKFEVLAGLWFPSMLKLAISGNRVLAQQGETCILQVCALGGTGYPCLITLLCDGCVGKYHQNHIKCCVIAVTVALRVWSRKLLDDHSTVIMQAIKAATVDRDAGVREEGRRGFWALYAIFKSSAEEMMSCFDSRSKKQLEKIEASVNREWEEGGDMWRLTLGYEPVKRDVRSSSMAPAKSKPVKRFDRTKINRQFVKDS